MSSNEIDEKFNLDAPAINNYANMLLQDIKNYQYTSDSRYDKGVWITTGIHALKHLISDMPPKGEQFIKETCKEFDVLSVNSIYFYLQKHWDEEGQWEKLDEVFNKAKAWLWPNVFELNFNLAKPRSKEEAKIRG